MATSNYGFLFIPGIDEILFELMKSYKPVWRELFNVQSTKMRYIDRQTVEGYQLPVGRVPGQQIADGQWRPSFNMHYVIRNFGLKDSAPEEDIEDDLYGAINRMMASKAGAFARSFQDLMEYDTSNYLSVQGFASGSNVAGTPDGKSIFNTAHPISASNLTTTWANRPSVEIDLSVAGAQAAATNLRTQKYPNNLTYMNNEPAVVCFNPALHYIAQQVYKGLWEPNTANRNDNNLRFDRVKLVPWAYWTKSGATGTNNAWFVLGRERYLRMFIRQGYQTKTQPDINTNSLIIAATCRYTEGIDDPRGTWGTTGA